jgi:3-oxoacyl-[acyl-carrier protein] reductase
VEYARLFVLPDFFLRRRVRSNFLSNPEFDQIAIVTGGSRGIGRAISIALARRGAAVCVNYFSDRPAASAVVDEILSMGGRALALQADVANSDAVVAMVQRAGTELGPITILINNAGIVYPGSLETFRPEHLARMRAVNVDGTIFAIKAVSNGMRERCYGRIVNIGSVGAIGNTVAGTTFYGATKAEISILTRRFAMELGRYGVTVNNVVPGTVLTDIWKRGPLAENEVERRRLQKELAERSMVGRLGTPEDIANAVVFLADQASGWITAQDLVVDGGRMDYVGHS